jgi:NADPH:quinone reductase
MMSGVKAWHVTALGRPTDIMHVVDVADPSPGPGQVAVRVQTCALGFPDVLMARGEYQQHPVLPFSPGGEIYGTVVALGAGVELRSHGIDVGTEVIALGEGLHGGLADIAIAPANLTFPAPPSLAPAPAAALYGAYLTAWLALYRRASLRAGEYLLVQAAAGGVGTAAVELGLAAGAQVIGVVRGQRKAEIVRKRGAQLVIDREREHVINLVNSFTEGHGVDVAFDPVGGDSWTECTKCIAQEGRVLPIGFAGGSIPTHRMNHVLIKNYSVLGVNSGAYVATLPDVVATAQAALYRMVEAGEISPLVGWHVPFEDAAQALDELGDGRTIGRSVVYVSKDA